MKKAISIITFTLIILFLPTMLWSQDFLQTFLGTIGRYDVTKTTTDQSIIASIKADEKDPAMVALLSELTAIQRATIATNTPDTENYCEQAKSLSQTYAGYKILLRRKNGQQTTMVVAFPGMEQNKAKEIVVISCTAGSLTIIDIAGNISLEQLSNQVNAIQKLIVKL